MTIAGTGFGRFSEIAGQFASLTGTSRFSVTYQPTQAELVYQPRGGGGRDEGGLSAGDSDIHGGDPRP